MREPFLILREDLLEGSLREPAPSSVKEAGLALWRHVLITCVGRSAAQACLQAVSIVDPVRGSIFAREAGFESTSQGEERISRAQNTSSDALPQGENLLFLLSFTNPLIHLSIHPFIHASMHPAIHLPSSPLTLSFIYILYSHIHLSLYPEDSPEIGCGVREVLPWQNFRKGRRKGLEVRQAQELWGRTSPRDSKLKPPDLSQLWSHSERRGPSANPCLSRD